jgi:transketolase
MVFPSDRGPSGSPPPDIPTAYSGALLEVGAAYPAVVVLDADLADSSKTEPFYKAFPGRAFDLGVAEQSLPTFAAGLALAGLIPFCNTFAVFAVSRAHDMIRQSVAYARTNVKLVGHAAGLSLGYAGPSHHALEDIGALRCLPNMTILCPSDADETRQMVWWMAEYDGPVYLRLSRAAVPPIHDSGYRFAPGVTELLREGSDVTAYVSGDLVTVALQMHQRLAAIGLSLQVVNVPTLKPLQPEEILRHGRSTRAAITIEEHSIIGGLGSAVAEIYAERLNRPLRRIGIRDTFTESDDRPVLLQAYGVSLEHAEKAVLDLLAGMSGRGGES